MNDYKTVKQVSEMLGVNVRTIRYWIEEGRLPNAVKIDDRRTSPYLIPVSDLEAFLEENPQYKKE